MKQQILILSRLIIHNFPLNMATQLQVPDNVYMNLNFQMSHNKEDKQQLEVL